MNDLITSYIRTIVPIFIGAAASWATRRGLDIHEAEAAAWLTPTLIGAYYVLVRAAERYLPSFGWLLGTPRRPVYAPPTVGVEH